MACPHDHHHRRSPCSVRNSNMSNAVKNARTRSSISTSYNTNTNTNTRPLSSSSSSSASSPIMALLLHLALFFMIVVVDASTAAVAAAAAPLPHHQSQNKMKIRNENVHTPDFDRLAANIMQQSAASLLKAKSEYKTSGNDSGDYSDNDNGYDNGYDNDNIVRRRTQSQSQSQSRYYQSKTQPIRIKFLTTPLEDAIAQTTNPDHKAGGQLILDTILPNIADHFQRTISVAPLFQPINIPQETCFGIYQNYIPENYQLNHNDADIIIIVSSFHTVTDNNGESIEFCSIDPNLTTLAAAISCGQEPFASRPIIGLMNICLAATSDQPQSNMEEILSHELLHVFVLNEYLFPFYRNAISGRALSNPDDYEMTPCVNDKDDVLFFGIGDTTLMHKRESVVYSGKRQLRSYYEVTLPTVRQVVRNQFNCGVLSGARLENQPTNPNSCMGAHFDERFFQYNLMSALYDSTSVHFSPLTLALMEDSGWYKVDFRESENSPFGLNSGCSFVTEDCIVDDQLPSYSVGNFCSDETVDQKWRCDPGHNYRGVCDLYDYRFVKGSGSGTSTNTQRARPDREYFSSNPYLGPMSSTHADWCPTVTKFSDLSAECTDVTNANNKLNDIEFFGDNSRCMDVSVNSGERTSLCISAKCDYNERQFVFDVGGSSYSCAHGEDGKTVVMMQGGDSYNFTCPKLTQACPDMFCPAMCSGKGICDWEASPMPVCKCFDASDTTAGCFNSQPNNPDDNVAVKQSTSLVALSVAVAFSLTIILY